MIVVRTAMLPFKHLLSVVLHKYADFRVGATDAEKHCYKRTDSILLTFDDYGDEAQISTLLSILAEKDVRAMFFLQGDFVATHPELAEKITRANHIVGNHTYSHKVLRGLPDAEIRDQISRAPQGYWFRPPQGRYNKKVRAIAHELGFVICYWTIDSRDWTGASVQEMRHTILTELHKNAVILFHINGKHTADLLPGLIDDIRLRGFKLMDHSEPDWTPSPALEN